MFDYDLSRGLEGELRDARQGPEVQCMHYDDASGLVWTGHSNGGIRWAGWLVGAAASCSGGDTFQHTEIDIMGQEQGVWTCSSSRAGDGLLPAAVQQLYERKVVLQGLARAAALPSDPSTRSATLQQGVVSVEEGDGAAAAPRLQERGHRHHHGRVWLLLGGLGCAAFFLCYLSSFLSCCSLSAWRCDDAVKLLPCGLGCAAALSAWIALLGGAPRLQAQRSTCACCPAHKTRIYSLPYSSPCAPPAHPPTHPLFLPLLQTRARCGASSWSRCRWTVWTEATA